MGFPDASCPGLPPTAPMSSDEIPDRLLMPLPPFHPWSRLNARRIRCAQCGLLASSELENGQLYTVWSWRNLIWDSRQSSAPTCPPNYLRRNGINPTVVIRT